MFDFYNNDNFYPSDPDQMKGLSDEDRLKAVLCSIAGYVVALFIGLAVCALFNSCSTPRVVEEHHHHHYEADTLAVRAQVDRQLTNWHEESEAWLHQAFSEQSSLWSSHEDQKEVITETVTVSLDSLGREIRTEQRTISRDITRELQQQEQRITQEYEARLRACIDSASQYWHQQFDSLASHITSTIDHQTSSKPSAIDARPWYQRWWDALRWILLGAVLGIGLWVTRKWWLKLIKPI